MSPNRRIFLNILATYGRSLYALVIGLFCGRWTLMALGEVDYGLNGLVGGLTCFISFINIALSGAISRYYAFTIGAETVAGNKDEAIDECRHWFNIALFIHTIVPTVLICVGYPIGVYAVSHLLTIPADRISDCICVLRCTAISCYLGMVSVPFVAMYNAKQYIAELTIYSFVTATLNAIFLYYMVTHPGLWLSRFAIFTCLLAVIPQIIICARAMTIFPECKVCVRYMIDRKRMSKIGGFAGWHLYGMLCSVLRSQGVSIVINKFFGATMNAAQAIGNTMQGHCTTLSGAMQGAFMPVITQACGAKDYAKMNEYALRTCKFNMIFSLVFMIPLALELPEVLRLWLKNPPTCAAGLCYCAMALYLVGSSTMGHIVVVNAMGRIALFHAVLYSIDILTVPFAVFIGFVTRNVYAIMSAVVLVMSLNSFGRVFFAKAYANTSIRAWLFGIMLPVAVVTFCSFGIGFITRMFMAQSFLRICCTTSLVLLFFIPACWFFILSKAERMFVVSRIPSWLRREGNI